MALYDATDSKQVWAIHGGGPATRLNDKAVTALPIPDPATLNAGITQALTAFPGMPIGRVDLRISGNIPRLEFAEVSGERDSMRRFYSATGAPMTQIVADGDPDRDVPGYVTRRNTLKGWHRGNIIGVPGQFIGLFGGRR